MVLDKSTWDRNKAEKLNQLRLSDKGTERANQEKSIRMICHSMEFNTPVNIVYADKETALLIIGHIHYFNEMDNYIKVVDKFEQTEAILLESIIDIYPRDNPI
ncbi:YolD-like family protein [Bacillus sp. MMSF_3328]|uniref:YolD-like family protein n=1 Tax=Bacillus sp. MMSF_3328 TaxID=3047080 RepID=UPI00273FBBB2|nr:YolD-like family protein [Bacillus sp. MMSF_3328]